VDWRKYHRDHVVHQPQVAYVVLTLLDELLINGQPLIEHCVDYVMELVRDGYLRAALHEMGMRPNDPFLLNAPHIRSLWRAVFRETAFLAALFHDIGYPWQFAHRLRATRPTAPEGRHLAPPRAESVPQAFPGRFVPLP